MKTAVQTFRRADRCALRRCLPLAAARAVANWAAQPGSVRLCLADFVCERDGLAGECCATAEVKKCCKSGCAKSAIRCRRAAAPGMRPSLGRAAPRGRSVTESGDAHAWARSALSVRSLASRTGSSGGNLGKSPACLRGSLATLLQLALLRSRLTFASRSRAIFKASTFPYGARALAISS
jgi:hypothetical protein